jgi:hypothetical protein
MKNSCNDAHNCHCLKYTISKNSRIPIEDLTYFRLGREFNRLETSSSLHEEGEDQSLKRYTLINLGYTQYPTNQRVLLLHVRTQSSKSVVFSFSCACYIQIIKYPLAILWSTDRTHPLSNTVGFPFLLPTWRWKQIYSPKRFDFINLRPSRLLKILLCLLRIFWLEAPKETDNLKYINVKVN